MESISDKFIMIGLGVTSISFYFFVVKLLAWIFDDPVKKGSKNVAVAATKSVSYPRRQEETWRMTMATRPEVVMRTMENYATIYEQVQKRVLETRRQGMYDLIAHDRQLQRMEDANPVRNPQIQKAMQEWDETSWRMLVTTWQEQYYQLIQVISQMRDASPSELKRLERESLKLLEQMKSPLKQLSP